MKSILIYTLMTLLSFTAYSVEISFTQNPNEFSTKEIENLPEPELNTFAQAAKWADLIAIAQVDDIEYKQIRELNSDGYAFLNILIPYKGASKDEPIAVLAKGFDDNVCYYPDRVNEGERFLVFLKKAPNQENNVYYGFKPYCQFQILLSELGQYILRTPLDQNKFEIDKELIETHQFNDPHAMIDATLWTGTNRKAYSEEFQCKIIESEDTFNRYYHLRYTQGVPIYKVRKLLELEYKPRITSKEF